MRKRKIIVAVAFIILSACQFYLGYLKGYNKAKKEIQVKISTDKKTLDNHGKILKTIYSESDSAVSARLKKNIGTN